MGSKFKDFNYYNNMEISIAEFLYLYLGKADQRYFKMTHQDLKILLPMLKRSSFDYAINNKKLIYTGDLILVKDSKKHIVPYFNPFRNNYEIKEIKDNLIKEEQIKEEELFDLKELEDYQLLQLLKKQKHSKNIGRYKICRMVRYELDERGIKKSNKKRMLEKVRYYDRRMEND